MTAHVKAQLLRFVRASAYAFVAAFLAACASLSWWQLLSLAAGAAEAGLRQVFPVTPVPSVVGVLADPPADAPPPATG